MKNRTFWQIEAGHGCLMLQAAQVPVSARKRGMFFVITPSMPTPSEHFEGTAHGGRDGDVGRPELDHPVSQGMELFV